MDIKTVALRMYPYWILGIFIIIATLRSEHKDLMRFQSKSFVKFLEIMFYVVLFRLVMMYFNPPKIKSAAPVLQIPLLMTGTVWWEDCCHTLPLALLGRYLGDSKISKLILLIFTLLVSVSFGLGHRYEGISAVIMMALYVPYVTGLGKKHGFSTIMACHMLYDFVTLLTLKLFLGV